MGNIFGRRAPPRADGKVVLITGCSKGGIGFALAQEFRARGAVVFATARNVAAMEGLEEQGIRTLPLDVTSQDSISKAVEEISQSEGRIDILVNNAGISVAGPLVDTPLDVWSRFYATNVFGVVAMCQAVFPVMARNRSGRILNIGSVAGIVHRPWNSVYSSTKAALHCLTNCLRLELKPFGVGVTLVAPGYIATNVFSNNLRNAVTLPPSSFFAEYEPMYKQLYEHKQNDPNNTPASVFASQVVDGALCPTAPRRLVLGSLSTSALLMSFLPFWVSDRLLWAVFGDRRSATTASGGKLKFP